MMDPRDRPRQTRRKKSKRELLADMARRDAIRASAPTKILTHEEIEVLGWSHDTPPDKWLPSPFVCAECNEPQMQTYSGLTCKNGHGGAGSIAKKRLGVQLVDLSKSRLPAPEKPTPIEWSGEAGKARVSFVELPSAGVVQFDTVAAALAADVKDAYVKVAPSITQAERESFDIRDITNQLMAKGACAVVIAPRVIAGGRVDAKVEAIAQAPSMRAAARAWFEQLTLTPEDIDHCCALAEGFIEETER